MDRHWNVFAVALLLAGHITPRAVCVARTGEEIIRTGRIEIHGNERVRDEVILRAIPLRPGDPFDYATLERARENLFEIPGIDFAEIRVAWEPADSALGLRVFVTEERTFSGSLWLQRGYENKISIGGRALEENFRGRSERLEAYFVVIGNEIVGLSWEDPWLVDGDARLGIRLEGDYRSYRYTYDDFDRAFRDARITRWGAALQLFHEYRPRSRFYAALGYRWVDGDRDSITIDPGGDRFPTVELGVVRDARTSERFPFAGTYARALARVLGPGDDLYNIVEGVVEGRVFLPVAGRTVLAGRAVWVGRTADRIPVYRRQHLGGGITIRGWEYGTFNGENSLLGGVEYRVPFNFSRERPLEDILLGFELHVFADGGGVWDSTSELASDAFHAGYGVGFSLLNPYIQGIRFDYGWRRGGGEFHFEIGMMF